MRRYLPIIALLPSFAFAQTPAQQSPVPTFTSKTELVTVPVVVLRTHNPMKQLDARGWIDEHVTGLKKEDFAITEDGNAMPVASFEEIAASAKQTKRAVPPAGVYTNELVDDSPVAMMVIVFDTINTPYNYQENTKKKILEFLAHDYKADRPTMLVALHHDKLQVLHDFTADPKILADIVQRLQRNNEHDPTQDNYVMHVNDNALGDFIDPAAEYAAMNKEFMGDRTVDQQAAQQMQIDRLQMTLYEMQQLAQSLSAVRGMKTLIWATGGIVLPLPNTHESNSSRAIDDYNHMLRLMTAAGVSIYPIDVNPDVFNPGASPAEMRNSRGFPISVAPSSRTVQGVQNLMDIAKRTGGDYCLLRKDYDWCFKKAADYNAHFYLLSYYTHTTEKPQWRTIKVNVRGEHLDVRARTGFFSGMRQGDPEVRRKNDIAQAFAGPVDYRGLAISVRWKERGAIPPTGNVDPASGSVKRAFILQVDPASVSVEQSNSNHVELDIAAIATDDQGKVLADSTQHLSLHPSDADLVKMRRSFFAYTNSIALPDQATAVKFIVRDDLSERLGTLTVPLH